MKKVLVNGAADVRVLSPFAYKDPIKSLEKSNEARVSLDGKKVLKSAVTSGKDSKGTSGETKYHLYFYPADGGEREWMRITADEARAYRAGNGYVFEIETAPAEGATPAPAPVVVPEPAPEPAPAAPAKRAPKRVKRETATA